MDLCLNNPFRILGLTATANEREITKRVSDLIIYSEMQKQKNFELDMAFIKPIIRTPDTIQEAKKKIEQVEERLFNSLFWLWNNTSVDQLAFEFLRESNIPKAIEILKKGIKERINENNFTTHINLSVLYLLQYRTNGSLNKDALKSALTIIGNLFSNSIFLNIIAKGIHRADSDTVDRIITRFINIFLAETEKDLAPREVIELLGHFDESYRDIAIRKYTLKQIDVIDNAVEITKDKRLKNVSKAYKYGSNLFNKVKNDLTYLESILKRSSIRYEMIADKVAEEILQCSITYYNHYQANNELDPGEETFQLMNIVQEIGIGATIKKRISENLPVIKRWIENKPERDAYNNCWYCGIEKPDTNRVVKVPMYYLDELNSLLAEFQFGPRTIRYKHFEVEIHRCHKCCKRHSSTTLGYGLAIGFGALIISFIIASSIFRKGDAVGLVSLFVGIMAFFIAYYKLKDNENKKYGTHKIKSASDNRTHPLIQHLLKEGWKFGSKPPNVQ